VKAENIQMILDKEADRIVSHSPFDTAKFNDHEMYLQLFLASQTSNEQVLMVLYTVTARKCGNYQKLLCLQ